MARGISIEGRRVEGDIMDMESSKHRIGPFILEKETPERTAYNYLIKFPSDKVTNMRVDGSGSQMYSHFTVCSVKKNTLFSPTHPSQHQLYRPLF